MAFETLRRCGTFYSMSCRENDAQVRARLTIQPLSRALALAVVQAISLKNCAGKLRVVSQRA